MLRKLIAIAWKDIYITFRDRNAIMVMFAMPIALSIIIGLAFGSGGDISINPVAVGVVNHDDGVTFSGSESINFGQTFEQAFISSGDAASDADFAEIHALVDGKRYDDEQAARDKLESGDLTAVITLPDRFTADAMNYFEPSTLHLYLDSGSSIGPSIVQSIVNAISSGMNSVLVTLRHGGTIVTELGQEFSADQDAIARAMTRVNAEAMSVAQATPVRLEQLNMQGETRKFDALQYFAPSMAILFLTFAMATGATTILTESKRWTLQRIITTPTPRWVFMGGKLGGIYVTGIVQMIVLILSTSLIARMMGRTEPVWGTNLIGIVLLVLAVVLASTALGLLIAAVARTTDEASTYSTLALFVLGMLGGSFIPIEGLPGAIRWLPKLTLNYWGIDGFFQLAVEDASVLDISPNVLILLALGVVFFAISLWRFSRRVDLGR